MPPTAEESSHSNSPSASPTVVPLDGDENNSARLHDVFRDAEAVESASHSNHSNTVVVATHSTTATAKTKNFTAAKGTTDDAALQPISPGRKRSLWQLASQRHVWWRVGKKVAMNPVIWGIVAGFIISFSKFGRK